jgi:signal transduction histidine kinase
MAELADTVRAPRTTAGDARSSAVRDPHGAGPYAFALAASVATVGLKAVAPDLLGNGAPFLLLPIPVLISALYGGFGPAAVSLAITSVAGLYFTRGELAVPGSDDVLRFSLYVVEALAIAWVSAARMRSQQQSAREHAELAAATARAEELRRSNEELRRLNTEVRNTVAELAQANVRLNQSNRELEEFAVVASHDLQEPLRKILAFGDRLATRHAGGLGAEGVDYVRRMRDAARRMQMLVDDLLKLARVTTRAQPFERVDLTAIARTVVGDLEIRLAQSGGRVEIEPLPSVEGDPVQMRQLLGNLIANALKFARDGVAPLVRVSGRLVDDRAGDASSLARIEVSDSGIGFNEAYLDRIFVPFERLHARQQYEGTGMGLAICRKIVERHNGSITARSTPGAGSTFIIDLPA